MTNAHRAVFLDRDGTLNVDRGYLYRVEDFVWIEGAPEAVRRLNAAGLPVIVVTNQAGVARGYYGEADVRRLHRHMQATLRAFGAWIDAFYYSPFHPEGTVPAYRRASPCRKPGTGLFVHALRSHVLDPARSFMVGDHVTDIVPGRVLGMTTLLVETGHGAEHKPDTRADYIVKDVGAAVDRILSLCSTTPSKIG